MKKIFKTCRIICLCFLCVFSFCSCGEEIDTEKAKVIVDDFLKAVTTADYKTAETYLHPDHSIDLEELFSEFGTEHGVDLKSRITVSEIDSYSTTFKLFDAPDYIFKGSTYKATVKAKAEDKDILIEIEVIDNNGSMGVSDLSLEVSY